MKATEYLKNLGIEFDEELGDRLNRELKVKSQARANRSYKLADNVTEESLKAIKTNQKRIIAMTLLKADSPVTTKEWANLAEDLQTKQDPERIIMYYKRDLLDEGYIVEA